MRDPRYILMKYNCKNFVKSTFSCFHHLTMLQKYFFCEVKYIFWFAISTKIFCQKCKFSSFSKIHFLTLSSHFEKFWSKVISRCYCSVRIVFTDFFPSQMILVKQQSSRIFLSIQIVEISVISLKLVYLFIYLYILSTYIYIGISICISRLEIISKK